MSIAIISAETGYGHASVMNALHEEFVKREGVDVETYPTFYEDIIYSNRILSDFYNYLLSASTELCSKYAEFSAATRPDTQNDIYQDSVTRITNILDLNNLKAIVSTAPMLNHNMIRLLHELRLADKIAYYVVVTDPYNPMFPGFEAVGATRYYCPNTITHEILVSYGIEASQIDVTGYPLSPNFEKRLSAEEKQHLYQELNLVPTQKTILLNAGAAGTFHYIRILENLISSGLDVQVIFVCGKNKSLYKTAKRFVNKNHLSQKAISILPFVNNLYQILQICDLVVTKAGANSVFESLSTHTPVVIDGTHGFLYQEKGIQAFIESHKVGVVVEQYDEIIVHVKTILQEGMDCEFKKNIRMMNLSNGTLPIVDSIAGNIV